MVKGTPKLSPRAALSPSQRAQLRVETGCADKTIGAWARGEDVREATSNRLSRACVQLAIEVYS